MPRGALETRQLRLEFGHAGSFDARMRGMRVQVHRRIPCEGFLLPRKEVLMLASWALDTRQLRLKIGHAGSFDAQMRGTDDDAKD